ncbi:hypothetical protein CFP56_035868 [Quercus suber]|uniref:Uncharacterized protein n=1 Tax=Quercus suber TaxID=58331 RepID=A0AAW0J8L0_QUESU|nr:hypothetical protein CFP56_08827 [Quercus suber]
MANSNVMKVSMLIILLILSVHVRSFEALKYHERKTMQKRISSRSLLRELVFDLSKMQLNKRTTIPDDSNPSRLPPGGPDHQHNTETPALMP